VPVAVVHHRTTLRNTYFHCLRGCVSAGNSGHAESGVQPIDRPAQSQQNGHDAPFAASSVPRPFFCGKCSCGIRRLPAIRLVMIASGCSRGGGASAQLPSDPIVLDSLSERVGVIARLYGGYSPPRAMHAHRGMHSPNDQHIACGGGPVLDLSGASSALGQTLPLRQGPMHISSTPKS
jgi:hypothetical protein